MSHLHSDDKKLFLDTLNKKGFLLEERTFSVFEGVPGYHRAPNEKNKIITPLDDPEGRIEIESWLTSATKTML